MLSVGTVFLEFRLLEILGVLAMKLIVSRHFTLIEILIFKILIHDSFAP